MGVVAGGGIIAVKGLGGHQLVCDATDPVAVAGLRRRKRRPVKSCAVMARDVRTVRRLARVNGTERALLTLPTRPVALLRPGHGGGAVPVAAYVHPVPGPDRVAKEPEASAVPGRLGLFLPATGPHHLLVRELDRPLVVTSGNLSDEPISTEEPRPGVPVPVRPTASSLTTGPSASR
ncbi:Sua5/YciO/YrdC/YwlC family protein [Streptomyces sp. PmtG]